jgi:predicted transcriptional regulator
MSKFKEKETAQNLRRKGKSIRSIAEELGVSRGSVSIWCREIELEPEQVKKLSESQKMGSYIGRLRGAETQKKKRLDEISQLFNEGKASIGKLTDNEFFIAGIALYWGEGFKTGHKFGISNSDPRMILFMIDWFKKYGNISKSDIRCCVSVNEVHSNRIDEIEKYWSNLLKIPLSQFTKTSLLHTKNKKVYSNHNEHFGTIRIEARKSSKNLRKMLGFIEGLYLAA